ncbi:hypothetical protein HYT52_04875 [Candidatus Woesearchaeota archaeon]|nr:hypothetical protein [Candidatus Woesearchaeota archaeon]
MASSVLAIINGMTLVRQNEIDASYEIGVKVEEGWNLLLGVGIVTDLSSGAIRGGDIQISDINVIWAFIPTTQEYARVYPNPETDKLQSIDDDELLSTSFWLHSDKAGYLRFQSEPILNIDQKNLYSRWNFVGISPEFRSRNFEDIFTSCKVEKAYLYNNRIYSGHTSPSWEKIYEDTTFTEETEGLGFVVKVSDNCKMTSSGTSIEAPPALPKS